MSEQTQNAGDSIFADVNTKVADGLTESAEDTNSEPKPKTDLGAVNRAKQIKVWADRIELGEATLETLPSNMSWLKPLVEDEVNSRTKSKDLDAIVEAKLAEKEAALRAKSEAQKFEELKAKANSLDLDQGSKILIQKAVDRFRAKGMTPANALEEALNLYEITNQSGDVAVQELKKRMKVPLVNQAVSDTEPEYGTEEFIRKGDSKSRIAAMESILRGGGHSPQR